MLREVNGFAGADVEYYRCISSEESLFEFVEDDTLCGEAPCPSGSYEVTFASDPSWIGCYVEGSTAGQYELDSTHALYAINGVWRLANPSVSVTYTNDEQTGRFESASSIEEVTLTKFVEE